MKKRGTRNKLPLTVLGEVFEYCPETVDPASLDLRCHPPIEEIHERMTSARLARAARASKRTFEVSAVEGPDFAMLSLPRNEREADELIQYVSAPIVIDNNKVIYRHDLVQKAKLRKEPLVVFRIHGAFSSRYLVPFQARYASKEGRLLPTARMEIARVLRKDLRFELTDIQKILIGPKGESKWSLRSIESHVRVGELYDTYTGQRCSNSNNELQAQHFSNLLRFVELQKIRNWMEGAAAEEKHFVDMAVNAAEHGSGRVHDDLPSILKFNDTSEALRIEGLAKARSVLRANHPEVSKEHFPLNDLESATAKLRNPDARRTISGQIKNGGGVRFVNVSTELAANLAALDPALGRRIVDAVAQVDSNLVVDWVVQNALEQVSAKLSQVSGKITTLKRKLASPNA